MTAALVAISLVLSPAPLAEHPTIEEQPWPTLKSGVTSAVSHLMTPSFFLTDDLPAPTTSRAGDEQWAAPTQVTTTTLPPPPVLTPIQRGLARLTELGATWQLRVFECLAWFESRFDPYAVSATNDHGLWQINRRFHAWRWAGRDIYDPAVNAEVAWDIYRESGFRAWTTHRLCGV